MSFVHASSWFIARVVSVLLFVIGFIPYSLVMRLVGFDPLDRDPDVETDSYWSETTAENRRKEEFEKQY